MEKDKNEEIKSEWEKIKIENNYSEPKEVNTQKSDKDLFRVVVGEDGLVKRIEIK